MNKFDNILNKIFNREKDEPLFVNEKKDNLNRFVFSYTHARRKDDIGTTTFCAVYDRVTNRLYTGTAKLNPLDNFCKRIGREIAAQHVLLRMPKISVNDFIQFVNAGNLRSWEDYMFYYNWYDNTKVKVQRRRKK